MKLSQKTYKHKISKIKAVSAGILPADTAFYIFNSDADLISRLPIKIEGEMRSDAPHRPHRHR